MKYALSAATLFVASPVLAHGGPHLHPHGSETWIAVLLAAGIGAAFVWAIMARRK